MSFGYVLYSFTFKIIVECILKQLLTIWLESTLEVYGYWRCTWILNSTKKYCLKNNTSNIRVCITKLVNILWSRVRHNTKNEMKMRQQYFSCSTEIQNLNYNQESISHLIILKMYLWFPKENEYINMQMIKQSIYNDQFISTWRSVPDTPH